MQKKSGFGEVFLKNFVALYKMTRSVLCVLTSLHYTEKKLGFVGVFSKNFIELHQRKHPLTIQPVKKHFLQPKKEFFHYMQKKSGFGDVFLKIFLYMFPHKKPKCQAVKKKKNFFVSLHKSTHLVLCILTSLHYMQKKTGFGGVFLKLFLYNTVTGETENSGKFMLYSIFCSLAQKNMFSFVHFNTPSLYADKIGFCRGVFENTPLNVSSLISDLLTLFLIYFVFCNLSQKKHLVFVQGVILCPLLCIPHFFGKI